MHVEQNPQPKPNRRLSVLRMSLALFLVVAGTVITVMPAGAAPGPDSTAYWEAQTGGQCWKHTTDKANNAHGSIKTDGSGHQYITLKPPPASLKYVKLVINAGGQNVVTDLPTVGPSYYGYQQQTIDSWIVCKGSVYPTTTKKPTTTTAKPTTTTKPTTTVKPTTTTTAAPTTTTTAAPTTTTTTTSSTTSTTAASTTTTSGVTTTTAGGPTTTVSPSTSVASETTIRGGGDSGASGSSSGEQPDVSVAGNSETRAAAALALTGGSNSLGVAVGLGLLAAGALLIAVERRRMKA